MKTESPAQKFFIAALLMSILVGTASAQSLPPDPPEGKGRLYFFPGPHMINSFDVILNDVDIGAVHHGEYMAIDVPPGQYVAERRFRTIWGGLGDPTAVNLDVLDGQKIYMASTRYVPPYYGGGALGYLLSTAMGANTDHPPGDFFEIQPNSDGLADKTSVSPIPQSVNELNAANPQKSNPETDQGKSHE